MYKNNFFLEVTCTKGRVYKECGKNCGTSCRGIEPENCKEECVEGCQCPNGQKWDEESQSCVTESECKCHFKGETYGPGTKRMDKCNTCKCINGNWQCTKQDCSREYMHNYLQ